MEFARTLTALLPLLVACGTPTEGLVQDGVEDADEASVFVFWPKDGKVHVRVAGDAFDPQPSFVELRTELGATASARLIEGSYWFAVPWKGDVYLDVTPVDQDEPTRTLRAQIPPTPLPTDAYVCCATGRSSGTCQTLLAFEQGIECPDEQLGVPQCEVDTDCQHLEGVTLELEARNVSLRQLDDGTYDLSAAGFANALFVFTASGVKHARLTDDRAFMLPVRLPSVPTSLTVQVHDIAAFRSPEVTLSVP